MPYNLFCLVISAALMLGPIASAEYHIPSQREGRASNVVEREENRLRETTSPVVREAIAAQQRDVNRFNQQQQPLNAEQNRAEIIKKNNPSIPAFWVEQCSGANLNQDHFLAPGFHNFHLVDWVCGVLLEGLVTPRQIDLFREKLSDRLQPYIRNRADNLAYFESLFYISPPYEYYAARLEGYKPNSEEDKLAIAKSLYDIHKKETIRFDSLERVLGKLPKEVAQRLILNPPSGWWVDSPVLWLELAYEVKYGVPVREGLEPIRYKNIVRQNYLMELSSVGKKLAEKHMAYHFPDHKFTPSESNRILDALDHLKRRGGRYSDSDQAEEDLAVLLHDEVFEAQIMQKNTFELSKDTLKYLKLKKQLLKKGIHGASSAAILEQLAGRGYRDVPLTDKFVEDLSRALGPHWQSDLGATVHRPEKSLTTSWEHRNPPFWAPISELARVLRNKEFAQRISPASLSEIRSEYRRIVR